MFSVGDSTLLSLLETLNYTKGMVRIGTNGICFFLFLCNLDLYLGEFLEDWRRFYLKTCYGNVNGLMDYMGISVRRLLEIIIWRNFTCRHANELVINYIGINVPT